MQVSNQLFTALIWFWLTAICSGQTEPVVKLQKRTEMIPMRDGVRLHTQIFIPENHDGSLPFLMMRSPYGNGDGPPAEALASPKTPYWPLVKEGYIFVLQDIRGRNKSEGQFEMQRRPRDKSDPAAIDENSDTNDTIDWLLKNIPNNNGLEPVARNSAMATARFRRAPQYILWPQRQTQL